MRFGDCMPGSAMFPLIHQVAGKADLAFIPGNAERMGFHDRLPATSLLCRPDPAVVRDDGIKYYKIY